MRNENVGTVRIISQIGRPHFKETDLTITSSNNNITTLVATGFILPLNKKIKIKTTEINHLPPAMHTSFKANLK